MEAREVMAALERAGAEGRRKIYRRHGYAEPMFGVSFADLGALKKKVMLDQKLADALWRSGNADARILATMVADPEAFTMERAEKWVKATNFRTLTDHVGALAARSPSALALAERWTRAKDPRMRQAACVILSKMGEEGREVPLPLSREMLERIEREIHGADNWSRYGMMFALIGIGGYNPALRPEAIAAARRIGKVEFDPGETSCKMPDPVPYIEKMAARQARAKKAR